MKQQWNKTLKNNIRTQQSNTANEQNYETMRNNNENSN